MGKVAGHRSPGGGLAVDRDAQGAPKHFERRVRRPAQHHSLRIPLEGDGGLRLEEPCFEIRGDPVFAWRIGGGRAAC